MRPGMLHFSAGPGSMASLQGASTPSQQHLPSRPSPLPWPSGTPTTPATSRATPVVQSFGRGGKALPGSMVLPVSLFFFFFLSSLFFLLCILFFLPSLFRLFFLLLFALPACFAAWASSCSWFRKPPTFQGQVLMEDASADSEDREGAKSAREVLPSLC